jgi:hypothetical protein
MTLVAVWCDRDAGPRTEAALQSFFAAAERAGRVEPWLLARSPAPDLLARHPWAGLLLGDPAKAAFAVSGRGDVVYVVTEPLLHAPDALAVLREGVVETDADRLVPYATADIAAADGAPQLVASTSTYWIASRAPGTAFACRRGSLERELAGHAPPRQVVLAPVPPQASPAARGSRVLRPSDIDVLSLRTRRLHVAVLPRVTPSYRRRLASFLRRSRLTAVEGPAEAAASIFAAAAVTNPEKEELDAALRDCGASRDAVFVELTAPDAARSLRWIPGRDWLLPGERKGEWML